MHLMQLLRITTRPSNNLGVPGTASVAAASPPAEKQGPEEGWKEVDIAALIGALRPAMEASRGDDFDTSRRQRGRKRCRNGAASSKQLEIEELAGNEHSQSKLEDSPMISWPTVDSGAIAATSETDETKRHAQLDSPLNLDWDSSEYVFQSKLVEVKGPGDSLMDRQVISSYSILLHPTCRPQNY